MTINNDIQSDDPAKALVDIRRFGTFLLTIAGKAGQCLRAYWRDSNPGSEVPDWLRDDVGLPPRDHPTEIWSYFYTLVGGKLDNWHLRDR